MALFLTDSDVRKLFTVEDALASARRAFAALESSTMPQRLALAVPEHHGTHLSMPCYLRDSLGEVLSIKVASVFDGNRNHGLPTTMAHLIMHDASTGQVLVVMEAEYLTSMRTAAASAVATQCLARPEPRTLGIFGAGGQAEAHSIVFQDAFPTIRNVFVQARSEASAKSLCEKMAGSRAQFRIGVPVRECNILCLTTNSIYPLFDSGSVATGTHVNAVGAFRPDMREVGSGTVHRARVFVDQLEAAQRGAGDLIQAEREGWPWSHLAGTLSDLVFGRAPGRTGDKDVTLFKSVGLAVQDAAAAATVYGRALEKGFGHAS